MSAPAKAPRVGESWAVRLNDAGDTGIVRVDWVSTCGNVMEGSLAQTKSKRGTVYGAKAVVARCWWIERVGS